MTGRSLDSRREALEKAVSDDQASVDGAGPTHAQPPDDLSTKQAARAETRWENEGGRTLPPDRRPRATK